MPKSALVLFSGGQDSTTCLAWSLAHFDHVETVGFDYGQRHAVELDCRQRIRSRIDQDFHDWSGRLGVDHVLDLRVLHDLGETAMTHETEITLSASNLPTTFVPGRNILFLAAAAALAYRRDIEDVIGGMCETDYSGYPDCRDETIKAVETALALGLDSKITLHTPLMWLNKADTWRLAHELGGHDLVDLIIEDTHTCYVGDRTTQRAWGYGCGICPACELRAKGYFSFRNGS